MYTLSDRLFALLIRYSYVNKTAKEDSLIVNEEMNALPFDGDRSVTELFSEHSSEIN